MKEKTIVIFLIKSILLLAVFDGIRHYLIIGNLVTPIKEVSLIALFALILYKRKLKLLTEKYINWANLPIVVFLILSTPLIIKSASLYVSDSEAPINPYALHYKTIEYFISIIVLYNAIKIYSIDVENIIKFFIKCVLILIVVDAIAYFYFIPIFSEFRPYWGRISTGYPTVDGQVMCLALICSFYFTLKRSSVIIILTNIIIITGIVMQATATAFVSLAVILFFYIILGLKSGQNNRFVNLFTIITGSLFVIVVGIFLYKNYYDKLEIVFEMVERKSKMAQSVLDKNGGASQGEQDISFETRELEFVESMRLNNSLPEILFGGGTALGSYIEETYYFFIRSYGYVGLMLFLMHIGAYIFYSFFYIKNRVSRLVMFSILTIFLISCKAFIVPYMFSFVMPFNIILLVCTLHDKKAIIN